MFTILAFLVVVGTILWAINYAVPMEPMVKRIVTAVAVVSLVLYVARAFGLFQGHLIIPN